MLCWKWCGVHGQKWLALKEIACKSVIMLYKHQILDAIFLSACFISICTGLVFSFFGFGFLAHLGNFHSKTEISETYDPSVPRTNTKPVLIERKHVDKCGKILKSMLYYLLCYIITIPGCNCLNRFVNLFTYN